MGPARRSLTYDVSEYRGRQGRIGSSLAADGAMQNPKRDVPGVMIVGQAAIERARMGRLC